MELLKMYIITVNKVYVNLFNCWHYVNNVKNVLKCKLFYSKLWICRDFTSNYNYNNSNTIK